VVAVIHPPEDRDAVDLVGDAAPDAEVRSVPATGAADVAVALDDATDDRAGVIAVTDPAVLADETVQRSLEAVTDAGVLVVVPAADLPDDLPLVMVGEGGVTAGDVDELTATAYVAGTVALLAGQVTPAEAVELLANTADGDEHLVNAEAAVDIATNLAAGGASIPPPEDRTGGIPPVLVGLLAFGIAAVVIVGTIALANGKPRASRP
jgi:hypothetical protein